MNAVRLAVALGFVVTVCGCLSDTTPTASVLDQTTSPVPGAKDQRPLFNITDAPDESGIVMRGEQPLALTWFADGMRLVIGADIVEFCNGIVDFDIVSIQDVDLTEDRFVRLVNGSDMVTSVWPFTAFNCLLFTTVTPLATGTADLVGTDNDLPGIQPGEPHTNAWGWAAHGTLTDASGADVDFSGHLMQRFGVSSGYGVTGKIVLDY